MHGHQTLPWSKCIERRCRYIKLIIEWLYGQWHPLKLCSSQGSQLMQLINILLRQNNKLHPFLFQIFQIRFREKWKNSCFLTRGWQWRGQAPEPSFELLYSMNDDDDSTSLRWLGQQALDNLKPKMSYILIIQILTSLKRNSRSSPKSIKSRKLK